MGMKATNRFSGRRSVANEPVVEGVTKSQAGAIFWFMRKRLSGSYVRFTWARRS